jgi:hypothetical protein
MARTKNKVCWFPASSFRNIAHSIDSCLAHIINLASQRLISTYSQSPHYAPYDPKAHEPDTSKATNRDEIGLVRAISVKVCLIPFDRYISLDIPTGTLIGQTKGTLQDSSGQHRCHTPDSTSP